MKQFVQNEEAVSPVIGVILMVAITVILAAVIAAFVFGMAGNVQTSKTVVVTAKLNASSEPEFMVQGGADMNSLTNLIIQLNGTKVAEEDNPTVGQIIKINNNSTFTQGVSRIVVLGEFNDGTSQVLLDKVL
ncbi:type IV pilin [Methanofollis tationis]|uniref:Type IV pilin N-terminal domain-containing protein n=1 Tax=Methanofollis tationis TaxID=81417 RepID=A0A7K4HR62_9EURY|nr:type IV pilin N-terminal domain-containing protein [Methanofollis tationis]NVO67774.1 type IV pilin N-terminal domain-containing protein [Methanofollis tationis]